MLMIDKQTFEGLMESAKSLNDIMCKLEDIFDVSFDSKGLMTPFDKLMTTLTNCTEYHISDNMGPMVYQYVLCWDFEEQDCYKVHLDPDDESTEVFTIYDLSDLYDYLVRKYEYDRKHYKEDTDSN